MELQKQVVSLELAKKLKELGFKQESLFAWLFNEKQNKFIIVGHSTEVSNNFYVGKELISAYTVAELGEMLPKELYLPYKTRGTDKFSNKKRKYPQHPHCFFGGITDHNFQINYVGGGSQERISKNSDSEANARATMLIFLKENNLIQ